MSDNREELQKRRMQALRKKEEEESTKMIATRYGIPYADLEIFPIDLDALKVIPEETARGTQLAVFEKTGFKLRIGVRNPNLSELKGVLNRLQQDRYTYELYLVSESSLKRAWDLYKQVPAEQTFLSGTIEVSPKRVEALAQELSGLEQTRTKIHDTFSKKTTEALEIILAGSLALDASDVHIEPGKEKNRLRFRIDGVLYDILEVPSRYYALLLSRIKLVSELKLNVHDRAQDGRFTIKVAGEEVEVRTSTLPGPNGENVVLRILNPKAINLPFESLGMQPWVTAQMEKELKKPNGMILTTGPTGSGKTTTLYTFLKKVYTPEIKIITIEDPIEYHLKGVEQTQIDSERGYDFANGLRAIVRQDPDVILVGEIRDLETAETAMHAALTGHLVFSTLHTNSAAGTIPRLIDLGVRPSIISPSINIMMAQRLVRILCQECKSKTELTMELKKTILDELAKFPKKIPIPKEKDWQIYKVSSNKACPACSGLGYKGRIGIFEIILKDEKIAQIISSETSEFEIKREAERQDQITMRQDGILKVLSGMTDFEELGRVVGEE